MTLSVFDGGTYKDFYLEAALGNTSGYNQDFIAGVQDNLNISDGLITLWDNNFDYTPFTSTIEMFLSSTDAGDDQQVFVKGLDSDFNPLSVIGTLNGQTQVSIGNFRHVQVCSIIGTVTPSGDVYVAASDTLTGGVPDTESAVKSRIIQGRNITRNGFYMVPLGMQTLTFTIRASTDSATKPVTVETLISTNGGLDAPLNPVTYTVLGGFPQFNFPVPVASSESFGQLQRISDEKTFFQFKGQATSNNTKIFFGSDLLLIDRQLSLLTED